MAWSLECWLRVSDKDRHMRRRFHARQPPFSHLPHSTTPQHHFHYPDPILASYFSIDLMIREHSGLRKMLIRHIIFHRNEFSLRATCSIVTKALHILWRHFSLPATLSALGLCHFTQQRSLTAPAFSLPLRQYSALQRLRRTSAYLPTNATPHSLQPPYHYIILMPFISSFSGWSIWDKHSYT